MVLILKENFKICKTFYFLKTKRVFVFSICVLVYSKKQFQYLNRNSIEINVKNGVLALYTSKYGFFFISIHKMNQEFAFNETATFDAFKNMIIIKDVVFESYLLQTGSTEHSVGVICNAHHGLEYGKIIILHFYILWHLIQGWLTRASDMLVLQLAIVLRRRYSFVILQYLKFIWNFIVLQKFYSRFVIKLLASS